MANPSRHIFNANRSIASYLRKKTARHLRRRSSPTGQAWKPLQKFTPEIGGFGYARSRDGSVFYLQHISTRRQLNAVKRISRENPAASGIRARKPLYRRSANKSGRAATRLFDALTKSGAQGHYEKMDKSRIKVEFGASWGWVNQIDKGFSKTLNLRHGRVLPPQRVRRKVSIRVPARPLLGLTKEDGKEISSRTERGQTKFLRDEMNRTIRAVNRETRRLARRSA